MNATNGIPSAKLRKIPQTDKCLRDFSAVNIGVEFIHPVSKLAIAVEAPVPADGLWQALAPSAAEG